MSILKTLGYVILHELFHLNSLSHVSDAMGTGHVYDRWIKIKDGNTGRMRTIAAYGPILTKVLAKYESVATGLYTATNGEFQPQLSAQFYSYSESNFASS